MKRLNLPAGVDYTVNPGERYHVQFTTSERGFLAALEGIPYPLVLVRGIVGNLFVSPPDCQVAPGGRGSISLWPAPFEPGVRAEFEFLYPHRGVFHEVQLNGLGLCLITDAITCPTCGQALFEAPLSR